MSKEHEQYRGSGRRRAVKNVHKSRVGKQVKQDRAVVESQKALDDWRDAKAAADWLDGLDHDLSWRRND